MSGTFYFVVQNFPPEPTQNKEERTKKREKRNDAIIKKACERKGKEGKEESITRFRSTIEGPGLPQQVVADDFEGRCRAPVMCNHGYVDIASQGPTVRNFMKLCVESIKKGDSMMRMVDAVRADHLEIWENETMTKMVISASYRV